MMSFQNHYENQYGTRHFIHTFRNIHVNEEFTKGFAVLATGHIWLLTFPWKSLSARAVQETGSNRDRRDVYRRFLWKGLWNALRWKFLAPGQKNFNSNQYVLVITDRYSEQTRASLTAKT